MKRKITLSLLSFILVLISFQHSAAQCFSVSGGTLTSSVPIICPGTTFTLTATGASFDNSPTDVSYILQDSFANALPGTVWGNLTNGLLTTNLPFVYTVPAGTVTSPMYFRFQVTCSNIATTTYSNYVLMGYTNTCLSNTCTTTQYNHTPVGTGSAYDAGFYGLTITDPLCGTSINYGPQALLQNNAGGYTDWGYTGLTLTAGETGSVTASVYGGYSTTAPVAIWIDFDDNGVFANNELVAGFTIPSVLSFAESGSGTITIPLTLPNSGNYGYHLMRVRELTEHGQTVTLATLETNPCTVYYAGETFDYEVLIAPPGVTATASPNPICSGGTLQLSVSSVTSTITPVYSWSGPGSFTSTLQSPSITNISPTASGTYSVQVTVNGASSCSNTANIVASVVTTPVISLNPAGSATTCPGICQQITASGGTYQYQWYNSSTGIISGATTQTYCTATAGSYYITETVPSTTCTGTSSPTAISLYSSPVITSFTTTNNNFCYGQCTTLSLTGTPQTVATITPTPGTPFTALTNASGTYSITVCPTTTTTYSISSIVNLATSCSATPTASVTITVNPLPVTPTVTATSPTICTGSCTLLTFTGTANTNVSYTMNGVAQPTASLSATGIYTLTVCPTLTTTYSVTSVTNPATTCSITTTGVSATVTVNPLPTATIASNTAAVCAGICNTYTVTGTPNTNVAYTYTGLGVNNNITLSAAGTAVFTVCPTTDPTIVQLVSVTNPTTTCTQNLTGTVSTTVNPLPSVTGFALLGNNPICLNACSGSALSFTATPLAIITYSVSPGTTHTVTVTAGGTATVSVCPTVTTTYSLVSIKNPTTTCTITATGSITMTVNPLPSTIINGTATICNGNCTNLTFSGTSNAIVNYLWTPPGTASGSATLSATGTGTVTVCPTVTTTYSLISVINPATSCSSTPTAGVTVTVNQLPTASFSANTASVCLGSCATLTFTATANSVITYSVSTSGTTTVTASAAGTVAVTVCPTVATTYSLVSIRNPITGCTQNLSGTVTITVNPLPTPIITPQGSTTICQGGLVVLNSSTGLGYHYQWYGDGVPIAGATSSTYSTGFAGTYTVEDSNAVSCVNTSVGVVVTVVNTSAAITASGPISFCDNPGAHVTLTANAGDLYQWMDGGNIIAGATSNTYAATTSGSYQVVVTNNPNCSATSPVVDVTVYPLPGATIDTSGPTAFCPGGTVTLEADTGTGYSYQWYSSTGLISGAISPNYVAAVAGTYFVIVTSSHSCISISPTVAVTIYQQPTASITYSGDTLLCYNGNLILTANTNIAGSSYAWYFDGSSTPIPGAVNATYDAFVAGTYTVLITSPNGCVTMSAPVHIYMLPSPVVTAINPTTFCWGGASELIVGIGNLNATDVSYQWTLNGLLLPGANSNSIGASETGTYQCIITIPAANCSSSSSTIYIKVNPLPDPVVLVYNDSLATQNYFVSYEWFVNNSQVQGATGSHIIATQLGQYKVSVTDTNGCTAESEAQVVTTLSSPSLNITSITGADVKVYPNPANAIVNIEAPANVDVTLSSIDGKVLLRKNNAKEIDLSPYADGLYMLTIYDKNGERIKLEKLVKNSN